MRPAENTFAGVLLLPWIPLRVKSSTQLLFLPKWDTNLTIIWIPKFSLLFIIRGSAFLHFLDWTVYNCVAQKSSFSAKRHQHKTKIPLHLNTLRSTPVVFLKKKENGKSETLLESLTSTNKRVNQVNGWHWKVWQVLSAKWTSPVQYPHASFSLHKSEGKASFSVLN